MSVRALFPFPCLLFFCLLLLYSPYAKIFLCCLCTGSFFVLFQEAQLGTGKTTKVTIGKAVKDGLVDNETLGYFMARTQLFLEMASYYFIFFSKSFFRLFFCNDNRTISQVASKLV